MVRKPPVARSRSSQDLYADGVAQALAQWDANAAYMRPLVERFDADREAQRRVVVEAEIRQLERLVEIERRRGY